MLFTWGMIVGLVFLFALPQKAGSRLQLAYARVFRWPLAAGHSLTLASRSTALPQDVTPKEYQDLLANQRQLQNRIANLQAALLDTQKRNEQLAKLREKPEWENVEFRQARIIPVADQTIINRGTEHGVADGQFVMSLSERGGVDESVSIVGTVAGVDVKTAKIRLITDKGSRIFASIGSLTVRGIMEGQGNRTARIANISQDHKISKGDSVYVQKQPGLDVPVIVGRVVSCQVDLENPLLWDIRVEPVCDVAGLSDVAVVVSAARPH